MRLVIDGRRLCAGQTGVGRYLASLLAEWALAGLPLRETLVVLKHPSGREFVPQVKGLSSCVVGTSWPGLIWECLALGRILRPDDLLFAPTNLVPPTWRGRTVLVFFDAIQERKPEGFPWHVRWRFAARYRQAVRVADRIVVPSEATRRDVIELYGAAENRLGVIHPGVDAEFAEAATDAHAIRHARQSLGLREMPFFLFVGKRSGRRNIGAILEAFALHRTDHPEHRLLFVGPLGSRAEDAALAANPGVQIGGHVPDSVLRGLYASATALLYPSEYEGFGLPIIEAQASGCPVITLRTSALPEAAGDAAWYLERADADSLACAMHILATRADAREDLIRRGLDRVAQLSRFNFADAVTREIIAAANHAALGLQITRSRVSSPEPTSFDAEVMARDKRTSGRPRRATNSTHSEPAA
jgi:glycosyltransferase involved in cell wall biosynthesis